MSLIPLVLIHCINVQYIIVICTHTSLVSPHTLSILLSLYRVHPPNFSEHLFIHTLVHVGHAVTGQTRSDQRGWVLA